MIYLVCQVKSGLGEDTFWTWFEREFPNHKFINMPVIPEEFDEKTDCIIVYSTMGPIQNPYNKKYTAFCLAWELYCEMRIMLNSNQWDTIIQTTDACAKTSSQILVATDFAKDHYSKHGIVSKMPLGLDTSVFSPLSDVKYVLKQKYNIPFNKKIGYWGGTSHVMKGFDRLIDYATNNPDIFWIIVWKQRGEEARVPSNIQCTTYVHIPQAQINELMNCSDFFLCTSRLRPYYMTELEAMSAGLPFVFTETIEKDFVPSANPRDDIFRYGWDRNSVKNKWTELFKNSGLTI
jgi:glycosyltransferase involved in cell wall biosynthesis